MKFPIDRNRILWLILYAGVGFALISAITLTITSLLIEKTNPFSLESFLFFTISLLLILRAILILLVFIGISITMDVLFKDSHFVDNCLAFHIKKYGPFFGWIFVMVFSIFVIILLILMVNLFFGSAENFASATRKYGFDLFVSLVISLFIFILWIRARLIEPPKLFSSLANEVSSELMVSDPESAIRKAFIFFENSLRNKANSALLEKNKSISNLIGAIYGSDGTLTHEKREAIYNLMKGAYGLYRNDLAHNDRKYSLQQAHYILMLVDDLIRRLDESELRQSDSPSDN